MSLSTHILDLSLGRPAAGVELALTRQSDGDGWTPLDTARTNENGRVESFGPVTEPGTYRIRFQLAAYFAGRKQSCFYPFADVVFTIDDPGQHYHVPLLVSPYGYSTYRGS